MSMKSLQGCRNKKLSYRSETARQLHTWRGGVLEIDYVTLVLLVRGVELTIVLLLGD